jgi:hypothetical protein
MCALFWDSRHLRTSSFHHQLPPWRLSIALFKKQEVWTCLHFPISCLSLGNLDPEQSTAQHTGPWWIILEETVQETPELLTAWSCQISGSKKLKFHKIRRKMTNAYCLPSRNWSKLPTKWDTPSSGFPTWTNTCQSLLILLIIKASHAGLLQEMWRT